MIDIRVRSESPGPIQILFLIGPGGVGKSTVGIHLAHLLGWDLIDLDHSFIGEVGDIGAYIRAHGYEGYIEANSKLAHRLIPGTKERSIFVLSSGFLVTDVRHDIVERNRQLVSSAGHTVLILPSQDIAEACRIVVERQLRRGFGLNPDRERKKFLSRFHAYCELGQTQVFTQAAPECIAAAIRDRLGIANPR
jgi:shikimate kinase